LFCFLFLHQLVVRLRVCAVAADEPVLPELYQGAVALTHSADRFSQKLMVLAKEPD
jgi:hypothetical protein